MEKSADSFPANKLCEICGQKPSAYTCPRCNLTYCSAACYKDESKHLECSESFYRDQVMNELKAISLNEDKESEKESKRKMLEILKKESEMRFESEEFCDEDEEEKEVEEMETLLGHLSNAQEDKLIKAYEEQVKNWSPWWLNENIIQSSLIQENQKTESQIKYNENLLRNASTINTSKANELILVDICTFVYEFVLIGHVYQLDETDYAKSSTTDWSFMCDIVNSFIELDKLTRKSHEQHSIKSQNDLIESLRSRFELVLKELSESDEYQLKKFVNKPFLFGLLDEIGKLTANACKSYPILISKCYDLFETALDAEKTSLNTGNLKSIENRLDLEFPINPFHLGHRREQMSKNQTQISRKTKIQILTPQSSTKKPEVAKSMSNSQISTKLSNKTKHELKLFLKRLEFYFKWIQDNAYRLNDQLKLLMVDSLKKVKEEKEADWKEFHSEHEFIQRNLTKIRSFIKKSTPSEQLIQEIKNEN